MRSVTPLRKRNIYMHVYKLVREIQGRGKTNLLLFITTKDIKSRSGDSWWLWLADTPHMGLTFSHCSPKAALSVTQRGLDPPKLTYPLEVRMLVLQFGEDKSNCLVGGILTSTGWQIFVL